MEDAFKIYVDQLRNGHVEHIDETVDSQFLDIKDDDLRLDDKIYVQGEAYLAENDLIICLNVKTNMYIPCGICSTLVKIPLDLKNLYLTVESEEFKSGIFYFNGLLRESILLEIPQFAECNEGNCPQRKEIGKYLKKPEDPNQPGKNDGYHPFADLDYEENAK